mmetsp:Transcript_65773/g.122643  ORF Transcript_65773/g.122643 Transcript_65773/m.122643 type:complete len:296 (+) Transcript_65773:95-982(+)
MGSAKLPLTGSEVRKRTQRQGPEGYALGSLIAWSALLLYHGVNFLLLAGACTSRGCFEARCTTKPTERQCFPPLSDTYIIYDYDAPFSAYSRRVIVIVVAVLRAAIIPFLTTCSHYLLTRKAKLCCGNLRTLAFGLIMVSQAIFDILSIVFWNKGSYGQLHKVLSSILILHWLIGVLPVWNVAMSALPECRLGVGINWGLWLFAWADVIWLRKTVQTCDSWIWYLFEWLVIVTQGTSVIVGGLSMPDTFRLATLDAHKRPWCCPSWMLFPRIAEEPVRDEDAEVPLSSDIDEDGL